MNLFKKIVLGVLIMIGQNHSGVAQLSVLSSQIGYNLNDDVVVMVRGNVASALTQNQSYRVENLQGEIVREGNFEQCGDKWSASWWKASFKIGFAGKYKLKFQANNREFVSDILVVDKDILWNSCFSTIVFDMMKIRTKLTVTGKGWRDCGSDLQELSSHVVATDGLCDVIELASEEISVGQKEYIEGELIRGADFIAYYQDLAKEIGLGDGPVVHESRQDHVVTGNVAKAAYILARVSRLIKTKDAAKSMDYLNRSKKAYAWLELNGPIINNETQSFFAAVHGAPTSSAPPVGQWMTRDLVSMLRASLALFKAGEESYKDKAISYANKIMDRQVPESSNEDGLYGHFYLYDDFSSFNGVKFTEKANIQCGAWSKDGRMYNKGGHYPHYLLPFIEMRKIWGTHTDADKWDKCLDDFAYGYFKPACERSPFKILPSGYYRNNGLLYFGNWYHAHNNMYSFAAVLALEFEKYFIDPDFREIASSNLQWIAGLNSGWRENTYSAYKSYSFVTKVGARSKDSFSGIIGSICNGFSASQQFRIQPINLSTDIPNHWDNEGYIAHSLPFISALVRLKEEQGPISGIKKIKTKISIYPNPVRDKLTISGITTDYNARLINSKGQVILSQHVKNNNQLDLSNLSPGLYFLRLEGDMQELIGQFKIVVIK